MAFGMSERSSTSSRRWSGCSASTLPSQPISRPVVSLPAPGEHLGVGEHLVAGERADVVPVSSSNSALSSAVIRSSDGCLRPPLDVLREDLAVRDGVLLHLHGLAGLGPQDRVGPVADRGLVAVGDAEQHADHPHRHLAPRSVDEVEPVGAHERVEARGAELPHLVLERVHPLRREDPRHQAAVHRVQRRVLEDARRPDGSSIPDWMISRMSPRRWRRSASRRAPSPRRRAGPAPRRRSARCSRSAPRPGAAGTSG